MIHRIDGKVAIVGVLDVTEKGLQSIYCYYDPDFKFISPGTLAAIRELEFMQKMKCLGTLATPEAFRWYSMSRYNLNDAKSAYKANFKPAFV